MYMPSFTLENRVLASETEIGFQSVQWPGTFETGESKEDVLRDVSDNEG